MSRSERDLARSIEFFEFSFVLKIIFLEAESFGLLLVFEILCPIRILLKDPEIFILLSSRNELPIN